MLNRIIDTIPIINEQISLIFGFSLNIINPNSVTNKITPIFCIGNKIEPGSIPAKVVFTILALPKQNPHKEADINWFDFIFFICFRLIKVKNNEIINATKNAANKNEGFSFATSDLCWTFWRTPNPPDDKVDNKSGIIYLLFSFLLSLYIDIKRITIIARNKPIIFKNVILSSKNIKLAIVGITKPNE